jgi:hypothetical protein
VPEKPQITVVSSNDQETILHVKLKGFFVEDVLVDGTTYHQLSLPGYTYATTRIVGKPALPVISEVVGIPENKNAEITITNTNEVDLTGYNVYPFQTPLMETGVPNGFDLDQVFYNSGDFFPADNASKSDPMIWRSIRVMSIMLSPFKNKPSSGALQILKEFNVVITYSGISTQNVLSSEARFISNEYEAMYNSLVINYDDLPLNRKEQRDSDDYDYLIISADNYIDQLDKYIEHKQNKGFRINVVSTSIIGNTVQSIEGYISAEYMDHEIEYVLFVGDEDDIPVYLYLSGNSKGDYGYGCINGADYFAELAIGRFSVNSSEDLAHIIQKTINYENNPPLGNWLEKSLLIAHKQQAPYVYQGCKERVRTAENTEDGTYNIMYPIFDRAYGAIEEQGGNNANNQTIISAINEGRGLVNYRGHGAPSNWTGCWSHEGVPFGYNETMSLSNGKRTPIIFSIACSTGYILEVNCLAETFTNMEQGAVAFYGASDISDTEANHKLDEELYNQALNEGHFNICNMSNMAHIETLITHGLEAIQNVKLYSWCGDPSLEMWTDIPNLKYMVIDYNANNTRIVDSNNQPIANSKVCFTQGEIFEIVYTNENGVAQCSFDLNHFTQISANKHDYLPSYTQILSANEIWTSEDQIRGNIIIPSGFSLTIHDVMSLPKYASIIVKDAGSFTIDSDFTMEENTKIIIEQNGIVSFNSGVGVIAGSGAQIVVEGTLILTDQQFNNLKIDIQNGGEIIILEDATIASSAELTLHTGSVVSGQVGVSNTLTINGDLNALNGVTFTNLSSTTTDGVVIDNDNAINIATCQFNSSNLTGHVSLNDGVSISETNFDGSYVRLDIFTSTTSGLCEITDNTFENLLGSAAQPIPALRIEDFPMFNISGNIFTNNISDGIAVYNSGNISIPGHSISNNQINNQSGTGIIIYASVVDICDNQINDNKYGVATYHNSNVKLSGSVASAKRGIYQTITGNERNQVLAGSQSFPWHFTYNIIQETSSAYPRVYSTDGAPQNPYDIEGNCWGDNFTPATDLSPLSYYDYSPVWDCGLTLLSNPLPLAPRMAYETSLTSIEQENYKEAETQLKTIVTNWPESAFAGEALKTLKSVAAKTNTLDELVTYYNTNETIQASEKLAKLAGYLVADTRIIQKEFQDALSHYEEIIGNPPTQEDYIYASIDAGRVQYLMEKEGGKSAVNFKYADLIPPTKQAYIKNRRILLDEIKGDPIPESFEKQTDSDLLSLNSNLKIYPNPVLDNATIELNVGIQTNVIVEIIDISGKLIKQVNCQTTSTGKLKHAISTKGMNNGVYFIKASFNNGQSMSKIVVAK